MRGLSRRSRTILVTIVIALTVYGMPAYLVLRATANGVAFGLWPISWITRNAVFLYQLSVKSGKFEIVQAYYLTGVLP